MAKPSKPENEKLMLSSKLQSGVTENIFEQIVLNFPDIIHSVSEEGKILSTNTKACELLGFKKEELIGKSVLELYADDIQDDVKQGFAELKTQGLKEHIESKLKTKSGDLIDVEIRSLSIYNDTGMFVKTFSIIRDIRKTNDLKNQLVQHSKLAAIGELASGIMHDIRNPLTVITSYNNYFLKRALESGDTEAIKKCQINIEKAVLRIQRLSNHLREYSRTKQDEPEEFSLETMLDDCLLMLENRLIRANTSLKNELKNSDVFLIGRPNQLEQVIINILGNACDALVETTNASITVSVEKNSDRVNLSIKDNGPGIKPQDLEKIFDAFFTTKPKGQGTGLGLSICSAIIKEQGGWIDVQSVYGEGATFIITLPLDINTPLVNEKEHELLGYKVS